MNDDFRKKLADRLAKGSGPAKARPLRMDPAEVETKLMAMIDPTIEEITSLIGEKIASGKLGKDGHLTTGEVAEAGLAALQMLRAKSPSELIGFLMTEPLDRLDTLLDALSALHRVLSSTGASIAGVKGLRSRHELPPSVVEKLVAQLREKVDPVEAEARAMIAPRKAKLHGERVEKVEPVDPAKVKAKAEKLMKPKAPRKPRGKT